MSAKQPDWDHVHLSNFESKAFWHIHWLYKAKDLIETAHLLEPKIDELWKNYGSVSFPQYEHGWLTYLAWLGPSLTFAGPNPSRRVGIG